MYYDMSEILAGTSLQKSAEVFLLLLQWGLKNEG